jgi:hypothetical protein
VKKFPLLEQMRAQRQRREDELTAPLKAELNSAAAAIASLRRTVRTMEDFMGREISKHLMEQIGREISGTLRREIFKAVSQVTRPFEPITITLSPDTVRFMDPDSLERRVLDEYRRASMPNLSVRFDQDMSEVSSFTVVDIRLPSLGYRQTVAN